MMPKDLKDLLRAFNDHCVKYLVVGGYAFGVYAEPRATKDLDLLIRSDEKNSAAVFGALTQYGAPLDGLSLRDFMDGSAFQVGQHVWIFSNESMVLLSMKPGRTGSTASSMEKSGSM